MSDRAWVRAPAQRGQLRATITHGNVEHHHTPEPVNGTPKPYTSGEIANGWHDVLRPRDQLLNAYSPTQASEVVRKHLGGERVTVYHLTSFSALTGNALTTFLAALAFTFISTPNIILLPALVAFFVRIFKRAMFGRVTVPFARSLGTYSSSALRTFMQEAFFTPLVCSISAPIWPLFIEWPFLTFGSTYGFAGFSFFAVFAFMAAIPFFVAIPFMAFAIAFIALTMVIVGRIRRSWIG